MQKVEEIDGTWFVTERDEFTDSVMILGEGDTEEAALASYRASLPVAKSCNLENPECCESCQ